MGEKIETVGRLRRGPVWAPGRAEVLGARAGRPRPGENVTGLAPACRHAAGEIPRRLGVSPAAPETGVGVPPGASLGNTAGRRRSSSGTGRAHQCSVARSGVQRERGAVKRPRGEAQQQGR
ncbi:hypothetical protein NDU88_006993 [Pleurodeles waltl]|uniref:Uncharacterized protein n=1 Tax=Pleurodeles waltl TaxID=8319 RepID=A0AAV7NRW4_PLEWA|nr:hypothetical protein NDU88_006993 [Pleurodeles waltl]